MDKNKKSGKGKRFASKKKDSEVDTVNPAVKHSVYFKNLMAEQRVSQYFVVAEDAIWVLKTSTEQICNCIGLWKGDMLQDHDYILMETEQDMMTEFGQKIFRIGEILGAMQTKDPITFWTNGEKERILSIIIPMAKDAVKLRRKLTRISDSMIVDLKKLRRLVDIYGFSTSDKNSIPEFMDNIVEETESELGLTSGRESKTKTGLNQNCPNPFGSMFHFLRSVFKNKPSKESEPKENSEEVDTNSLEVNYSKSTTKTHTKLKTPSPRPSEKYLQKIASSLMTPKNLLPPVDYILDPLEARIKGVQTYMEVEKWKQMDKKQIDIVSPIVSTEISKNELEDMMTERAKKYFPILNSRENQEPISSTTCQNQHSPNDQDVRNPMIKKIDSGNQNDHDDTAKGTIQDNLDEFEQKLDSIGISIQNKKADDGIALQLLQSTNKEQESLGTVLISDNPENPNELSTEEQMVKYKSIVNEMHDSVLNIIEQVRCVERAWMTTGLRPGMAGLQKIGDLLAFIGKTVELIDTPEFGGQVYADKKRSILQAIDPVYREAHSCFIALGELTQVVSTDVSYLRELMEHFPKGDLIVYEYSSNASLESFDQIEVDYPANYTIDLDAIFG